MSPVTDHQGTVPEPLLDEATLHVMYDMAHDPHPEQPEHERSYTPH